MTATTHAPRATPKQKSNTTKGSLVKVVVSEDLGKWVSPATGSSFSIDASAQIPAIKFQIETAQSAPYKWSWSLVWIAKVSGLRESTKRGSTLKTFRIAGRFESGDKAWVASVGGVMGGRLSVEVSAGTETFRRAVHVKGTNPSRSDVEALLATMPNVEGFDTILAQESHFKNFIDADGQPIVAFDRGYGMTQLTNPPPTFEQAWNWKENIRGGVALYQAKQNAAKSYLSQSGRTYSAEQLRLETWSRWNGGGYHVWDPSTKSWARNDDMLCDVRTGNIGWDISETENSGHTEAELHARDASTYKNPKKDKGAENKWKYTGVCYADHLNGH